nr:hypothetical protein [Pseudomonas sp. Pf153]
MKLYVKDVTGVPALNPVLVQYVPKSKLSICALPVNVTDDEDEYPSGLGI